MSRIKFTVTGLNDVLAGLIRTRNKIAFAVQREVGRSAINVMRGAKLRCPVDTGRLRNSIAIETSPNGFSAWIGTNVFYAAFVEFGTVRMAAQPYLWPALHEEAPRFKRNVRDAVARAIA